MLSGSLDQLQRETSNQAITGSTGGGYFDEGITALQGALGEQSLGVAYARLAEGLGSGQGKS